MIPKKLKGSFKSSIHNNIYGDIIIYIDEIYGNCPFGLQCEMTFLGKYKNNISNKIKMEGIMEKNILFFRCKYMSINDTLSIILPIDKNQQQYIGSYASLFKLDAGSIKLI